MPALTAGDTGQSDRRGQLLRLDALGDGATGRLRIASLCTVLAGWLLIPQAAAIAWALQQVFMAKAAPHSIVTGLAVLLAAGLLRAVLNWCARAQSDAAVEIIRQDLRASLIRRLLARGPLWLRQRRSGELAELMGTHVDALEGYFGGYVLARAEIVAVPLALLVAVLCVDRVVGMVLLLTLPLIPLFMMLVGWGAEAASRRQLQAMARMGGHFADRLRGLGLIRLYGRGDAELAGVHDAAETLRESSLKVLRIAFLSSAVLEFFASLGVAMVAVYLGFTYLGMLDFRGAPLSLGVGVFCLLLAPEYYAPLRRLAAHYHDRANALAALEEIDSALTTAGTQADSAAHTDMIRVGNVTPSTAGANPAIHVYRAALRPIGAAHAVLNNLSFDLEEGAHLALAGPSGCGKSTLLEALAGWLPADAGQIAVREGWRIGYAPQRPYLFHGSIADNLRMALPHASDAQLHAAAEAAQVMRFASGLPRGLDTMIGERGFGLSGGEARRIALARVFLRDPQLLLLDEPTSFLDPQTEAELLQALAEFARGRTLIMATHSAAAISMAGRVLWLPQGSIAGADA